MSKRVGEAKQSLRLHHTKHSVMDCERAVDMGM
jgi:hypothetical protein